MQGIIESYMSQSSFIRIFCQAKEAKMKWQGLINEPSIVSILVEKPKAPGRSCMLSSNYFSASHEINEFFKMKEAKTAVDFFYMVLAAVWFSCIF